jgi:hypothetical protein
VFYNPTAYTNSRIPIRAEILNDGFPDRSLEVQLWVDNELRETRTIFTTESRSIHTEEFEVNFSEEGTKSLRIQIPEIGEEWTTTNNRYSFSIDVKDDQIRILHIAFEVHPDVGNFRNLLATDESVILKNLTWTGQSNFVGGNLPEVADTLDLIILHGYPHALVSQQLGRRVTELVSGSNSILLSLPGTRHDRMADFLANMPPLRATGPTTSGRVLPFLNESERDHPIFDLEIPAFTRAPELSGVIRNQQTASNARVLMENSFRGSNTGIPMIILSETGNQRFTQVNAWNWYLWQQSTQSELRAFYRSFFNNIVKWTAAEPEDNILDLSTIRQNYDEGDAVQFRANVRTETGAPDTDARVEISITGESTEPGTFVMRHLGTGRFSLEAGSYPAGTYQYTGRSFRGNTQTAEVSGSFIVTESILEFMDTMRRDGLLQLIAEESGGGFFTFDDMSGFRNKLQADGLLDYRSETYQTIQRVHHSLWWFLLVIILLTAEWFLRKKYDMA